MFQLNNVVKQYSRRGEVVTAFHCADLTIEKSDYVAMVGPSGSGKTTLLSMLGGMLSPTTGSIRLDSTSIYDLSAAARSQLRSQRMGFVFQTFNLIPYLTALQNVQVPLCLLGRTQVEQEAQAVRMLDRFGLGERLHHRPAELSVGQQQRVALARTLVNDPQIVLADEPTGNLDPESREVVLGAFDEAYREGRTIIMVTHDPVAANRASRTLLLQNGELKDTSMMGESCPPHLNRAA